MTSSREAGIVEDDVSGASSAATSVAASEPGNFGGEAVEVQVQEDERWKEAMRTVKSNVTVLIRDELFRFQPMFRAEKEFWKFDLRRKRSVCHMVLERCNVLQWGDAEKKKKFWEEQMKVVKGVWNSRRNNVNGMIRTFLESKYSDVGRVCYVLRTAIWVLTGACNYGVFFCFLLFAVPSCSLLWKRYVGLGLLAAVPEVSLTLLSGVFHCCYCYRELPCQ
jgi:hypothetical protein